MSEHVVVVDDSTLSLLAALRNIADRHDAVASGLHADLDRLVALCADSDAGQAFLTAGAADLIAAVHHTAFQLETDIRRINDGLAAGIAAIAQADQGPT